MQSRGGGLQVRVRLLWLLMAVPSAAGAAAEQRVLATITFTGHDIPHIAASDFEGLGHGTGYAMALADLCALAEAFATYGGHRSEMFGAEALTPLRIPVRSTMPNVVNDLTTRLLIDDRLLGRAKRAMSPRARALVRGYATGFNRRVAETTPENRPQPCREAHAVTFIQSSASAYFLAHVMDGSRGACAHRRYSAAPRAGVLPGAMKPALLRTDYVANSNDSHWITNPAQPLEGFSPLIGQERMQQGARTRLAHIQVRDRLAGMDGLEGRKFDRENLQAILFSNRNLMGEILVDDLLALCAGTPRVQLAGGGEYDLARACAVLAHWDRRDDLQSRGAYLFREFLDRTAYGGPQEQAFWRESFDPQRPLDTPRGLRSDSIAALEALAAAAHAVEVSGLALDVPLGEVQFVVRDGHRIPMHGGPSSSVFNVMDMTSRPGIGYTDPVVSGATYIQVVSFEAGVPVADALLVSGQTSDTASPPNWQQTELYSQKRWVRLPFLPDEVAKNAVGAAIVLRAP